MREALAEVVGLALGLIITIGGSIAALLALGALLALLAGGALAALAWMLCWIFGWKPEQGAEKPPPKPKLAGKTLPGRIVRVTDGDGLIADIEGCGTLTIRLAHIDAPEYDQPGGLEAKEALRVLARGRGWQFELLKEDHYGRTIAVVSNEWQTLSDALVRTGHAWTYKRYVPTAMRNHYTKLERGARQRRDGLWGGHETPIAPWEWRSQS